MPEVRLRAAVLTVVARSSSATTRTYWNMVVARRRRSEFYMATLEAAFPEEYGSASKKKDADRDFDAFVLVQV